MKQKFFRILLDRVIIIVELGLLVFFVYWKYRLGITRYFDIDEYAHLHWAFNFFSGFHPYSQFLYFFPPLYLFILYPLLIIAGKTALLLTLGRIQAFVIFIFLLLVLGFLVKKLRGIKTAILTLLIFAFLPLPADKLLEIRPDTISTAITILGMIFFIYAQDIKKCLLFSGICFGIALMIVPKVIFFIPAVFIIMVINFRKKIWHASDIAKFAIGFLPPLIFTLLFFIAMGKPADALYYSTIFISNASRILGDRFPMRPELFFYPNDIFYGKAGINPALILNLIIYLLAGFWGTIRLVSFLDKKHIRYSIIELFIAVAFLTNFLAYILYFPMKHTQYFIAFAPFIAFYFSDMIVSLSDKLIGKYKMIFSVLLLIFLIYILRQGNIMNSIKANWTNHLTFENFQFVQERIAPNEYVFDLYGQTLFYKDPYFICCLSYGEYMDAFKTKLPSLPDSLRRTQTKYVYPMTNTRLGVLPPIDERFIRDHYIKVNEDPVLWISGAAVNLKAFEAETIDLIVGGKYRIYFNGIEIQEGDSYGISIDGENKITSPVFLEQGDHKVVSGSSGELKMVYSN